MNVSKLRQENPPRLGEDGTVQYFCTSCLTYKNFDQFRARQGRCKTCHNEAAYASRDTDKQREYASAYHRRKKYGITDAHFKSLLERQGGRCAVCERTPEEVSTRRSLVVDHNHETGEVRGLLCHVCNAALGLMQDDANVLLKAARYLGGGAA